MRKAALSLTILLIYLLNTFKYSSYTDLLHFLSRVQRERVLRQADLQVSVAKLGLTRLVEADLAVIIPGHGVEHYAVMPWRHHDHTNWSKEHSGKGNRDFVYSTSMIKAGNTRLVNSRISPDSTLFSRSWRLRCTRQQMD